MVKRFYLIMIPFVLAIITIILESKLLLLLTIFSIYLVVAKIPNFKHHENIGVATIGTMCSIILNTKLAYSLIPDDLLMSLNLPMIFLIVLYFIIFWFVLFCLEQLFFGIIAAIIWKDQYPIRFKYR